jgi:regulatory subunit for Cdc7p protein kinase
MKIWTTAKLESVLERCLVSGNASTAASQKSTTTLATPPKATTSQQRSLTRLLASERLHGTTTERDPTQKRHDFRYFSRSSCFVLVEDMRQELATIHVLEYSITKGRDGVERAAWPVLYCHPQARGPFLEFDEKEKKRWEKSQRAETEKEREQEQKARKMREEMKRKVQAQRKAGDLRRSVSMNNLHRRASLPDSAYPQLVDLDGDASGCDGTTDSANASGYLASGTGGYMAASGNSVGITSTTGTTSTAGASFRNLKLPAALQERIQSQVVTSRKFPSAAAGEKDKEQRKKGTMGPPAGIPERPNGMLRKSRSANTLRLPKREEGCKPGYCESCRIKFDDFKSVRHAPFKPPWMSNNFIFHLLQHIRGRKHRKFAQDDSNFLQLDFLLSRVRRRTFQEVEDEKRELEERRQRSSSGISDLGEDDDDLESDRFLSRSPQDMGQTIRPWDDADGDALVH